MSRLPFLFPIVALLAGVAGAAPAAENPNEATEGPRPVAVVRGLSSDDLLNIRATASPTGIVLGRIPNGSAVSLSSCETVAGYVWCRVESFDIAGLQGWTPARYLHDTETGASAAEMAKTVVPQQPGAAGAVAALPPAQSLPPLDTSAPLDPVDPSGAAAASTRTRQGPDLSHTVLLSAVAARQGAGADLVAALDGRHEHSRIEAAGTDLALGLTARLNPAGIELYTPLAGDNAPPVDAAPAAEDDRAGFIPEPAPGIPLPTPRPDAAAQLADAGPGHAAAGESEATQTAEGAAPVVSSAPAERAAPPPQPHAGAGILAALDAAPAPSLIEGAAAARATAPAVAGPALAALKPQPPAASGILAALDAAPAPQPLDSGAYAPAPPSWSLAALAAPPAPALDPALAAAGAPAALPPRLPLAPAAAAPARPALDAFTVAQVQPSFDATGEVPCARYLGQPMTRCTAGVVRTSADAADVTIRWFDGGTRVIRFRDGRPEGANGRGEFRYTREADLNLIRVGTAERFEIPDALAFGD